MRICIVGGGLTGAVSATLVRKALPEAHIELWDKAPMYGGRMCTKCNPAEPKNVFVDLGAQYISSSQDNYKEHTMHYSSLLNANVLAPMMCIVSGARHSSDMRHFVAPAGMTSVVQHFVDAASCQQRLGASVQTVTRVLEADEGPVWRVTGDAGDSAVYDAVLLTMLVPQLLDLQGDVGLTIDKVPGLRSQLEKVRYSSRFAMAAFYPASALGHLTLPDEAAATYLSTPDSPFCYIAVDALRRGGTTAEGVGVVAHTSRPWGGTFLHLTEEEAQPKLLTALRDAAPHWPRPDSVVCHKWKYSQVLQGVPCNGCVSLPGGLVLSGDAFTSSGMDGCLRAATQASAAILLYLRQRMEAGMA